MRSLIICLAFIAIAGNVYGDNSTQNDEAAEILKAANVSDAVVLDVKNETKFDKLSDKINELLADVSQIIKSDSWTTSLSVVAGCMVIVLYLW
ncbi:hypothetical protein L596_020503 [Steinernema carpocapsae]|uniref:SXP/RAL-2 family protein Ani s 5-like cation-binding domain-containing protein n=1 Tax=Steinernema carpocapsae TaxID=34508 RepID=A0A4U5MUE5_STECR|nr:hypothetical protein L596_020503 [Steinernema carpocapsae]